MTRPDTPQDAAPAELREEVARLAALAGLCTLDARNSRQPPNDKWSQEEWERRILECIPTYAEKACFDLADAVLALPSLRGSQSEAVAVPEQVLIGGNHLASALINRLGANFCFDFPPDADPQEVLRHLSGKGDSYDVWCCWAAIMRARNAAPIPSERPAPGEDGPDYLSLGEIIQAIVENNTDSTSTDWREVAIETYKSILPDAHPRPQDRDAEIEGLKAQLEEYEEAIGDLKGWPSLKAKWDALTSCADATQNELDAAETRIRDLDRQLTLTFKRALDAEADCERKDAALRECHRVAMCEPVGFVISKVLGATQEFEIDRRVAALASSQAGSDTGTETPFVEGYLDKRYAEGFRTDPNSPSHTPPAEPAEPAPGQRETFADFRPLFGAVTPEPSLSHIIQGYYGQYFPPRMSHDLTARYVAALAHHGQRAGGDAGEVERQRDQARELVTEANNSLFGSQGYFHSLNGGPFDKYHLSRAIEELKQRSNENCRRAETAEARVAELEGDTAPREEFEAWWKPSWMSGLKRDERGRYACAPTSEAWSVWRIAYSRGRAATAPQPPTGSDKRQEADGGEDWTIVSPDPATRIATDVANLPWARVGVNDADVLAERHGDVQAIAARVLEAATPAKSDPERDGGERRVSFLDFKEEDQETSGWEDAEQACQEIAAAGAAINLSRVARRYMLAIRQLGQDSGYNKLTFFEAPISKMPNDDLGMEAVRRWRELNEAGKALTSACDQTERCVRAATQPDRDAERRIVERCAALCDARADLVTNLTVKVCLRQAAQEIRATLTDKGE